MPTLCAFVQMSLDGYYVDATGDMSWAHKSDAEFQAFTESNAKGGARLLFGRSTYDLMASYWPTPHAAANNPVVAERMNQLPKVVFSRTLDNVSWNNTTLVKGNLAAEVRRMKKEAGEDLVILGSGNIISQLTQERLIDVYQIVLNPIVLGQGKSMFDGVKERLNLKLTQSRVFNNGNVFLSYEPAA